MILGTGVDIVHLPRIAALIKRRSGRKLACRILSPPELQQWTQVRDSDIQRQVQFLGVRWAVKEAAYKALYPTVKPTWKELSYRSLTRSGEKPSLVYHPLATRLDSKVGVLHVSVSHDGDYAMALVTAEGKSLLLVGALVY